MRRHISKRSATLVLLASCSLIAATVTANAVGTVSHHARSASRTTESFLLSYGPHESEVVVAHGVITGGGTDVAGNNSDTMHLGGGTLRINHPDSKSKFHQKLNPKTCFASFTITGPYTLDHGTGKYAGYTGSGTYKVIANAIAKRNAKGCNEQANPKVESAYILANGTVAKK